MVVVDAGLLLAVVLLLVSIAYTVNVVKRSGHRFELLNALLVGELGLIALVYRVVPDGEAKLWVLGIFMVAMFFTGIQLIIEIRRFRRKNQND